MEDRLTVDLAGRDHLERIIVKTKDGIVLRLGAADVTRKVVGTVDRAEPFLPLGELGVE